MLRHCSVVAACSLPTHAHMHHAGGDAVTGSSTFVLGASEDFLLGGGAGVQAAPLLSLRSGSPGGRSTAAARLPLLPGVTVERLAFSYRYDTGYGPAGAGSNFSVLIAGQAAYASPQLVDYRYNSNKSNYSLPVPVDAPALGIAVPAGGAGAPPARLEFDFQNNDRK